MAIKTKTYYEIENKTNNDFKKISEELNLEQKGIPSTKGSM